MKIPRPVETARAYLTAQSARAMREASQNTAPAEGPFVTISRESGTGAPAVAAALAERLGHAPSGDAMPWAVFDQQLIEQMLSEQRLSKRLARFVPEDRVSEIEAAIGEIVGLHPNLWGLVQKTNEFMRTLARKGHVVLVGRGAHLATAGIRHGLHVRLVAPPEERAKHTAARLGLSLADATTHNKQVDAARRSYVRSVFDANGPDPAAYDLVINTARFSMAEIVELLSTQLQRTLATAEA